jgi:hypothetical protein
MSEMIRMMSSVYCCSMLVNHPLARVHFYFYQSRYFAWDFFHNATATAIVLVLVETRCLWTTLNKGRQSMKKGDL